MDNLGKLDTIGITERSRWPNDATSAVDYIHSLHVIHGDIGAHNFLIHNDGRLVLCDFAGSGMEGLKNTVTAGSRYSHPDSYGIDHETGPEDDVFALGTVLYEVYFDKRLFNDQTSGEIRRKLRDRQYPDLSAVPRPLRNVIEKCWFHHGYKANEALTDLALIESGENGDTLDLPENLGWISVNGTRD
ncbi:kinase-like protein [Trematosphaeria pertusa]|uniref:Kinase-like protein n=1 Tax=Trematosphaeria pertusa TaxID=390896 RepID=A0A6A6HWU8_9PLEO|nr:kinase-like protein [Trematosphaeria pertusa]KAF2241850.1 kinase-like protein [Trematosphaeria pertusa]